MRPWSCSIIFTWHRKEPTHNKRRARWWQISLTLLWMKGENGAWGRGVWGERVPRRLPEVRSWPLAQPDGEHPHTDMHGYIPARLHVQSFGSTLGFALTIACIRVFERARGNPKCHGGCHERAWPHSPGTTSLWPARQLSLILLQLHQQ